jgi:uncharacterized protein
MESLFEKLKSLGVNLGKDNLQLKTTQKHPIENVIQGEWLHDQFGDLYKVNNLFSFEYQHGNGGLKREVIFSKLLEVTKIENRSLKLEEILFIDTETTGLSGGTGTMVFLVGLGYFTKTGFIIEQYFLDDPINEMELINVLNSTLQKYRMLVSYNGSSFDLPLLRTRFLINRVEPPFNHFQHLDLLHLSRKLWKLRLPTIKLHDVETEILNFIREEEEVPGWMVPQIYFDFIRNRDARPLKGVFYHNSMDVLSLAVIFIYISELLSDPVAKSQLNRFDLLSIARLFQDNGLLEESTILYKISLERGLPSELSNKILFRYGQICKRLSQPQMALVFWQQAYENGDIASAIQISKYYEHEKLKYDDAMQWAINCQKLIEFNYSDNQPNAEINKALKKRIKRLELRMSKNRGLNEK